MWWCRENIYFPENSHGIFNIPKEKSVNNLKVNLLGPDKSDWHLFLQRINPHVNSMVQTTTF